MYFYAGGLEWRMQNRHIFKIAKDILIGKARSLSDKSLFQKVSLIALFAWVGLGADGL